MKTQAYSDVIFGFFFLVVAGVFRFLTRDMQPDAASFVNLLANGMAIMSLGLVLQSGRRIRHSKKSVGGKESFFESRDALWGEIGPLLLFGLIIIYGLLFPVLGFKLSSFLLIVVCLLFIGGDNPWRHLPAAIAIPIFFDLVLRVGLHVRLPLGILPF